MFGPTLTEHTRGNYHGRLRQILHREIEVALYLDWEFAQRVGLTPLMEPNLMRIYTDEAEVPRFTCRASCKLLWSVDRWSTWILYLSKEKVIDIDDDDDDDEDGMDAACEEEIETDLGGGGKKPKDPTPPHSPKPSLRHDSPPKRTPSPKPSPKQTSPPPRNYDLLHSPTKPIDDPATVRVKEAYFNELAAKFQEDIDNELKPEAATNREGPS
ncbi:hypothetical protein L2E82_18369 [Cichorium intybus]|uniref:Uncharacterized protein n=1 Tax=Cichorium intybus TaxID=13427 RepID=A0ACB9F9X9_CICIN|nr:hypothetical protein L2E82_18369 [Cichorium intybus]